MSNVTLPRPNNIFPHELNLAVVAFSTPSCRDRHGEDLPERSLPSSEHRVTSRVFQIFRLTDDIMVAIVGHTTVRLQAKE